MASGIAQHRARGSLLVAADGHSNILLLLATRLQGHHAAACSWPVITAS
jgi:hypothetical protein